MEARIKSIDVVNRTAVITTADNREMALTFPDEATIEVAEPETMGTMGGELEDVQEGFYVEVEVEAQDPEGNWRCSSLTCLS